MTPHRILACAAVCALVFATGCKMPTLSDKAKQSIAKVNEKMPWHDEDAPREGVPTRVVGNWIDAAQYQQGKIPQRGWGGKLLFYDENGPDPIVVEGQLVIYAFNEIGRSPTDSKPTRRYVFPAEELAKHMTVSDAGPGYNVWVPWDEMGGAKAEVSLICRFEPRGGGIVISEQVRQYLPGPESPAALVEGGEKPKVPDGVAYKPAVEQASYHSPIQDFANQIQPAQAASSPAPAPRAMSSTTITLPESMKQLGPGIDTSNRQTFQLPARTVPETPQDSQSALAPGAGRTNGYRLAALQQEVNTLTPSFAAPSGFPPPIAQLPTAAAGNISSNATSGLPGNAVSPQTTVPSGMNGYSTGPLPSVRPDFQSPFASRGEAIVTYPDGK